MNTPHPIGWDSKTHYMPIGGQCGQSCPCCRSAAGDTLGACPICNQIKEIPTKHVDGWNSKTHYMSMGGQCGQSCPCCRSRAGDIIGSCQFCNKLKESN